MQDLWGRATAKWRGIVVYALLQAITRFVTAVIFHGTAVPGLKLFASLVSLGTSLFCVISIYLLLTSDRDGDEAWPPIWS